MTGYEPVFVDRAAMLWFGDVADSDVWKRWWQRPPETEEREAFYLTLSAFERDLESAEPHDIGEWSGSLLHLSEVVLRALESEFAEDQAVLVEGAVTWHGVLNRRMEAKGIPLRVCPVYPGQRFDPDSMEAVDSLSGNRLMVHHAQSWVVRDHSGLKPRVALRARVVTA